MSLYQGEISPDLGTEVSAAIEADRVGPWPSLTRGPGGRSQQRYQPSVPQKEAFKKSDSAITLEVIAETKSFQIKREYKHCGVEELVMPRYDSKYRN
jgi:hypothetical protein